MACPMLAAVSFHHDICLTEDTHFSRYYIQLVHLKQGETIPPNSILLIFDKLLFVSIL